MAASPIVKLVTPRPSHIVRRGRGLDAIDRGLRSGRCWLAAPAGYGKTTAAVDYLQGRREPRLWYRVDEGDQDIAAFFHFLGRALPPAQAGRLPVFGPEYADQPEAFALRFLQAFFARLRPGTLLVLDDLHAADAPGFRGVLAVLLGELPPTLRCLCLARILPPGELAGLGRDGRLAVIDQAELAFSDAEARDLVTAHMLRAASALDVSAARGWAAGLVLLAESGAAADARIEALAADPLQSREGAMFDVLGAQLFETLPVSEQDMLLKLNLLPEITAGLAAAMAESGQARSLLERLHRRQLLVARGEAARPVFILHDLLRGFLRDRFARSVPEAEQARLRRRAATVLAEAGRTDDAIDLALQGRAWDLARRLMADRAEAVLAQGRRATFADWCAQLPDDAFDGWLCYWAGVAAMPDDDAAEAWLSRAWAAFEHDGNARGCCLAVARAALVKTDSWRTHHGLADWTRRAFVLLDQGLPTLPPDEHLLVRVGLLRACVYADDYRRGMQAAGRLVDQLVVRLATRHAGDAPMSRVHASQILISYAGSTGNAALFETAVDSVADELHDPGVSPWVLGLWLVDFGAVRGRYFFPYARRGFPYADAEQALRAAIAIGEREALRGVEFGALYHLQLQKKLRNDWEEFAGLVDRLAQIADSRYTTQVAVVADCQAAMHTRQGHLPEAYRACDRFMAAIEAANEPPIERWPHFITLFQVLLADRRPAEAALFLETRLPLFDGAVLRRTEACVLIARAMGDKWVGEARYPERLAAALSALRAVGWSAVLPNLPSLLAELCADAIDGEVEAEFCRALIGQRRLPPPPRRPARWPWALAVHVLGGFRLEREGTPLDPGPKPPTRSLDILRALALARDHSCRLEDLQDWFWPDADGDRARAACEQALHRLRRLLGRADLVLQREGRLRLAPDKVWVDLDDWEDRLRRGTADDGAGPDLDRLVFDFPGPVLSRGGEAAWSAPAAGRLRDRFLDLVLRLGHRHERGGDAERARMLYLHGLDLYPDSVRIHEALIRSRLARADTAGALDDYGRYERMLRTTPGAAPSAVIHSLVKPLLRPA
ncbi:hypothetical protein [Inquilinus sp. Marseille-Q2685]|uniref:hypothetical protein n=1 Tax=Inquilinus sp. Marseille-Q2685 TaxID=2866581 RepID=UPI001CE4A55E|nr:hypothetical protein [Inquilinus sp. Marseille-Q2685]